MTRIPSLVQTVLAAFLPSLLTGACGAGTAHPLEAPMFAQRDQVAAALAKQGFCREEGVLAPTERFRRCRAPGYTPSESWVVAEYQQDGRLTALRRFVRFGSDARATDNWQELVRERAKALGASSQQAKRAVASAGWLPSGTTSWASWYDSEQLVVVSLYLVRPAAEGEPQIIEEIARAPGAP